MGRTVFGRMMASAIALTGAAYAQETTIAAADEADVTQRSDAASSSSDRVVYEAAFFSQFSPQNAMDMVRQTPGFSLDGGDDRRGFSGAVGNLLIDGLRPSTKSQSLSAILSRIPVDQVVRLEVLRGAAIAGDASGQSVLLNVVRTPTAGSGVWEAGFEYGSTPHVAPRGEASYSGRNGQFEYGVGMSLFTQHRALGGWQRREDASGTPTLYVDTPSPRNYREGDLNGNFAMPLWGGRLSTNARYDQWRFHADSSYERTLPSGAPHSFLLSDYTERGGGLEVGLNYDRSFGPWNVEMVGLINRRRYESDEIATARDDAGAVTDVVVPDLVRDTGETILRSAVSRTLGVHSVEFGGEGAFNTLDQEFSLTVDDGSGPTTIPIPNSNVLVEEERAEFFGVHTWRPTDRWSLESRVAWETSTLNFSGDANQSVELSFWKPSVQLTRTIGENNQVRFRLYRDVGQLDFDDFVSAVSVSDDRINGGNPDLAPETSWRAEAGMDWRFGEAALGLTLRHSRISDVADVVLVTAQVPDPCGGAGEPVCQTVRFDAPGNIGDGEETRLDLNFSTPLNFLLPGARVTIEGMLRESNVNDPVTGRDRTISFRPESQIEVEFRQDISSLRMAWGVSVFKQGEFQAYRFNEIDTNEEGPWIDAFIETTALPNNMRLRAWAANIAPGTINRDRRFFAPDRTGPFERRDLRQRSFDTAPWLIVELSGRF